MKFLQTLSQLVFPAATLVFVVDASAVNFRQSFQSALRHNETLAQSKEAVHQASEKIRQARGAVMPNLSAQADYIRQDKPASTFAQQFSPDSQTTAKLSVTQPIFHGFSEFAAMSGRKRVREAAENNEVQSRITMYRDVAARYFEILGYEQDLKNINEQLDLFRQQVKILQNRMRRGESKVVEALSTQSRQASLEAEAELVKSRLIAAREAFSFLTGLPPETTLDDEALKGPKLPRALLKITDYLQRIELRPDIISANKLVEAAKEEVTVVRGGHWPSLDATGNYYLKRPQSFLEDIDWDVQLTLKFPLFEGGSRQAQVREASSKKRVQELELAKLRRQAVQEIRSVYDSLKMRLNQVAALETTVGLAEKNYQTFQRELRNGLVSNIEAQVAMKEFLDARRTYDRARYEAQIDLIGLEAASFILPPDVINGALE